MELTEERTCTSCSIGISKLITDSFIGDIYIGLLKDATVLRYASAKVFGFAALLLQVQNTSFTPSSTAVASCGRLIRMALRQPLVNLTRTLYKKSLQKSL